MYHYFLRGLAALCPHCGTLVRVHRVGDHYEAHCVGGCGPGYGPSAVSALVSHAEQCPLGQALTPPDAQMWDCASRDCDGPGEYRVYRRERYSDTDAYMGTQDTVVCFCDGCGEFNSGECLTCLIGADEDTLQEAAIVGAPVCAGCERAAEDGPLFRNCQ